MTIQIPVLMLVILALGIAFFLSGLIIKVAKLLGRIIIFLALFYILLILFGII